MSLRRSHATVKQQESPSNEDQMNVPFLALILAMATGASSGQATSSLRDDREQSPGRAPTLAHTCLITENVKRLVDFYEAVLQQRAKWSGTDYAEFSGGGNVLAVFSASAQERYIPGSAASAKNRSVILEFRVADADREYLRLQGLIQNWVKPPTTQPWGTRSIYFRDPDQNLVDFFSPPSTESH
jgi:catechol 2,3-dioxygenase-like lactoylglutathione lyase family enzyme